MDTVVSGGVVVEHGVGLVAELAVEAGGLEAVRVEHDLAAAPPHGLALRRRQQLAAEPLPTAVFTHPEVADLATRPPRPSVESGDHDTVGIADEEGEQGAVGDAGAVE